MEPTQSSWDLIDPPINPQLVQVLTNDLFYPTMMPVQKTVIPLILQGYDVAVESCTGSGGIKSDSKANPTPSSIALLIATPGRLREQLYDSKSQNPYNFKDLSHLALDEADRLIEGGQRADLRDILSKIPKQRQTSLFSATLNSVKLDELVRLGLRNPAKVRLSTQRPGVTAGKFELPENLHNTCAIFNTRLDKLIYLWSLLGLGQEVKEKSIVFFNTCASVNFYHKLLSLAFP